MNWELFYLICFVAGFAFTAFSFLSGTLHFHFHLPHGHVHLGGVGHVGGAGHAGGAGHGLGHGAAQGSAHGARGSRGGSFGFFNPMSLAIFLAWFGGTGYLLVHLKHIWVFAGLVLSTAAGLAGAGLVVMIATKYFLANESSLDPMDFEMVGVLGKVSGTIRRRGTGEIIFEQEGARKACPARGEEDEEVGRGEEVVVTRFENGVAYVRRWSELAEKAGVLPAEEKGL
jgi:membrane protein implicated in regulation of membrane protease activity